MDSSNRSSSLVITGASQVVCISRQNDQNKRGTELRQIHLIQTGAVVISDGIIQWVGPTSDLPPIPADAEVINANGKVVLPGFIDSPRDVPTRSAEANAQRVRAVALQAGEDRFKRTGISVHVGEDGDAQLFGPTGPVSPASCERPAGTPTSSTRPASRP